MFRETFLNVTSVVDASVVLLLAELLTELTRELLLSAIALWGTQIYRNAVECVVTALLLVGDLDKVSQLSNFAATSTAHIAFVFFVHATLISITVVRRVICMV